MAKPTITDIVITEKGEHWLKPVAAGVRLIVAAKIMVLAVSVNAHDLRLCGQWLPINSEKPLRTDSEGNVEVGMLNMRFIARAGQTDCFVRAGHPNSCEKVILQWSRRYDVFPFPIGNRLEYHRDEYIGGIPAEAYCQ